MKSKNTLKENNLLATNKGLLPLMIAGGAIIFLFIFSVLKQIQDSQKINLDPLPGPNGAEVAQVVIENTLGEEILFSLEIADSPSERTQGLMHRTDIADNGGMLFIFQDSEERGFWMKNTPTSLDILYFDENFNLIKMYENTLPNNDTILYHSNAPAKYVVELKGGTSNTNKIGVGSKLILN